MTPDLTNFEDRSDRERRRREAELLALLLALFDDDTHGLRTHLYAALRTGADPFQAASDVLLGNPRLYLPGLPQRLAEVLADTERDGLRRAGLVVGTDLSAPPIDWLPLARQYAVGMLATVNKRIRDALATTRDARSGARQAIGEAFRTWGYSEDGPQGAWLLSSLAVTWAGLAYNRGQYAGWLHPDSGVTGFRYVSILDNRTSDICLAYDGVRLPIGHRWIRTHFPLNHFRCRSVFRPLFGRFEPTPEEDIPWVPPPQAGFGTAPLFAYGVPLYRAA